MTSRERVRAVLEGRTPDCVPIFDTYWRATLERWRREGMPHDANPDEYFDLDWVRLAPDYSLQFPEQVIEETDRYLLVRDANGVTQRRLKTPDGWTPHWEGFTIRSRADFEAHRHRWEFNESRISPALLAQYRQARQRGRAVFFHVHACFHGTWMKIGLENQLLWMVEDPAFIHALFEAHTRLAVELYEGMKRRGIEMDGAFIADDLGSTRSPLISPAMYREMVWPHHRDLFQHLAKDGVPTILHSDGNIAPLIPDFLKAGIRGLHPLEAKAGLHVRHLREQYGDRLVLVGNIDVRALAGTPEDVVREVREKVTLGKQGGGYIFHSDHSVPANVPLRNYQLALTTAREYGRH